MRTPLAILLLTLGACSSALPTLPHADLQRATKVVLIDGCAGWECREPYALYFDLDPARFRSVAARARYGDHPYLGSKGTHILRVTFADGHTVDFSAWYGGLVLTSRRPRGTWFFPEGSSITWREVWRGLEIIEARIRRNARLETSQEAQSN